MMITSIFALCMLHQVMSYQNGYDGDLSFTCQSESQSVTHVTSIHDNHHEDRMFDISCTNLAVTGTVKCSLTGYRNSYDQLLAFECPGNQYINGMYSHHDNKHEDRIWKFKCCEMQGVHLSGCSYTDWTNQYDGVQNFYAPAGKVTQGVTAVHDNHHEDRKYKFQICDISRGPSAGAVGK